MGVLGLFLEKTSNTIGEKGAKSAAVREDGQQRCELWLSHMY